MKTHMLPRRIPTMIATQIFRGTRLAMLRYKFFFFFREKGRGRNLSHIQLPRSALLLCFSDTRTWHFLPVVKLTS